MLAKLKVVSVLESLPGVGKVRARNIMSELEISETRRLGASAQAARRAAGRGSARRDRAAGCSTAPGKRDRLARTPRGPARPRRHVGGGQGHDRRGSLRDADPELDWSVSWTTRAPAARGESTGVDYHFVTPRGVRRAPRRGRLPRVVRGLRRPEGHARGSSSSSELEAGHDVLLEIDVQGALDREGRSARGGARVRPGPDPRAEQRRRLEARGERPTRERSSGAWPRPRPRKSARRERVRRRRRQRRPDQAVDEVAAILDRPPVRILPDAVALAATSADSGAPLHGRSPRLADGTPYRSS